MGTRGNQSLGVYLFSRKGSPLLASAAGDRLPLECSQVEGVLALAGEFENEDRRASGDTVMRVRYDGLGILGIRGERTVAAMVSRDPPDDVLIPELERFLRRCERQMRGRSLD